MGRPRGFDEAAVIRAAAQLFADRAYDGLSVDDLVTGLGVHRNSLYKTFGSKRGLYLAALRHCLDQDVAPLAERITAAPGRQEALRALSTADTGSGLDLLLLAAIERAPVDGEVAELVARGLAALDGAIAHTAGPDEDGATLIALALGLRVRVRSGALLVGTGTEGAGPATPPPAAPQPSG
ncbi:TetR/AcrR family transcriptional regulator [Streptomyces sp. NPDC057638]|uniref:TetR/AcrR family transcriptional regulator n=1 Tax=Streptomyces sp. NPDC057638 TaxID=3346190 RepID=UPI0036B3368B